MSLAMALRKSKNLVSIRVMQAIGARYAQEYVSKFGFDPSRTPAQLTTALGAGSTTPWEMAAAFSVFANGGYRVKPYLINKVTDVDGKVLMRVNNPKAGNEASVHRRAQRLCDAHAFERRRKRPGRHRTPRLPRAQAPRHGRQNRYLE